MNNPKETIQRLCVLADYVVTNGGENQYILDAIDAVRENELLEDALKLACNDIWIMNSGEKMPVYYIEKYKHMAEEQ